MRVPVTGAAGFIGSNLTDRLLSAGHQLIGMDNFITGCPHNVSHLRDNSRVSLLVRDVTLPLHVEGPLDWLLHFASPASLPTYLAHPIETLRANSEGTYRLLELAHRTGTSFLLASSSEVYGDPETHPQPEGYRGNVNPNGCRSVYDESKCHAEALTMAYNSRHLVKMRIIRIVNTYGPRMDSVLVLAYLVKEITESLAPIIFKPLPPADPKPRRPDISRAKALLHWGPKASARERLMRTVDYLRDVLELPSKGGV